MKDLTPLERARRQVNDVYYRWRLYRVGAAHASGEDAPAVKIYDLGISELESLLEYMSAMQYDSTSKKELNDRLKGTPNEKPDA
jgi:hypothetical protein